MIKHSFIVALFLSACSGTLAWADEREDALYIASIMQSDEVIEVQLDAITPMLKDTLTVTLQQQGVQITDAGMRVAAEMFVEEFGAVFGEQLREIYADGLVKHMSSDDIAAFRAFLESSAGMNLAYNLPAMTKDMARNGEQAGMRAGVEVGQRIADRLEGDDASRFSKADLIKMKSAF